MLLRTTIIVLALALLAINQGSAQGKLTCPGDIVTNLRPGQRVEAIVVPVPVYSGPAAIAWIYNFDTLTDNGIAHYTLGTARVDWIGATTDGEILTCSSKVTVVDRSLNELLPDPDPSLLIELDTGL